MTTPTYTESSEPRNSGAALHWVRRHASAEAIGLVEAIDEARDLALELALAGKPGNEQLLRIAALLGQARRYRSAIRASTKRRVSR
jgi:hypothetical protein